jgi:hypothetical protein
MTSGRLTKHASVSFDAHPKHDLQRAREREDDTLTTLRMPKPKSMRTCCRSLVERLMISPAGIFR